VSTDTLPVLDGVRAQIQRIQSLTAPLSQTVGAPGTTPGSFASVLDSVQAAGALPSDGPATAQDGLFPGLLPGAGGATGDQVVAGAERYLGVPYRWGGTDPATGLYCSGLVQLVYGQLGLQLPRTSQEQQQVGVAVPSVAQARPGDLVFYGSPAEHVGIYVGNGQMIDAPHTGTSVRIEGVGSPTSIRRIVGSGVDAGSMASVTDLSSPPGAGSALGSVPPALAPLFLASAARYGLSPQLLAAVGKVESGFNPNAVSPAGAQGLMQLMPSTAASLGVDPFDPAQAVDGAARLLSQNLAQFGGSVPLAVAAYNAGSGAVQTYGGIPPFPETQNYVRQVVGLAQGGAA
jgi:cell wall-associated NlpC family hydrolase